MMGHSPGNGIPISGIGSGDGEPWVRSAVYTEADTTATLTCVRVHSYTYREGRQHLGGAFFRYLRLGPFPQPLHQRN